MKVPDTLSSELLTLLRNIEGFPQFLKAEEVDLRVGDVAGVEKANDCASS